MMQHLTHLAQYYRWRRCSSRSDSAHTDSRINNVIINIDDFSVVIDVHDNTADKLA